MSPEAKEEWKTTRADGFARFVLSKLIWAFSMSTAITMGKLFIPLLTSRPMPPFSELFFYWIAYFIITSISGSIYAIVKWVRNEEKYYWGNAREKIEW
jgi:hypothetical protein